MLPFSRRRQGFTLIELLVVVLILGVLVAVALPAYINMTTTSRVNTADNNTRALAAALKSSAVKSGSYPSTGLDDATVISDMGGSIPNNPCSVSIGAAGYTYTYTDSTNVSIVAKNDRCPTGTPKAFVLKL